MSADVSFRANGSIHVSIADAIALGYHDLCEDLDCVLDYPSALIDSALESSTSCPLKIEFG
jgi:hypothetical protein